MTKEVLEEYGAGFLVSVAGAVIMGLLFALTYTETVEPVAVGDFVLESMYALAVAVVALVGAGLFYYNEQM